MVHQAVRNKRNGHQAEIEASKKINSDWPVPFRVERTGLDGGSDLRGPLVVGEVKSVRSGPAWLQSMIDQLGNDTSGRMHFGFVRLSQGQGHPVKWLTVMDFDQLTELLEGFHG